MSYVSMKEMLQDAKGAGYAVGAFNIVNHLTAQAAVRAASELRAPIILQTSVSTVRQIGAEELIAYLKTMAERADIPVAVHLDHCTDAALVRKCIDLGWSSVMIDKSKEAFETNLAETAAVVEYAEGHDVTVEGELGAIFGVEEEIVVAEGQSALADVDSSLRYVAETGIDAFAPAIGTAHGLYKGEPKVEFELFATLARNTSCPLVVHGGTGLAPDTFHRLIQLGAAKINVSTAIKIAYCGAMDRYTSEHPDENNPLKLDKAAFEATKTCVMEHVELFRCAGRA
jgi:fructose-bisphosphate aldolase, class II